MFFQKIRLKIKSLSKGSKKLFILAYYFIESLNNSVEDQLNIVFLVRWESRILWQLSNTRRVLSLLWKIQRCLRSSKNFVRPPFDRKWDSPLLPNVQNRTTRRSLAFLGHRSFFILNEKTAHNGDFIKISNFAPACITASSTSGR